MVDERTAYWGARDAARYRTQDDDPTGGDFVVAETLDANGDPVDVLLRWDDTAGEWVSGGPVNMNGEDVTNVGALDADSVSTGELSDTSVFVPAVSLSTAISKVGASGGGEIIIAGDITLSENAVIPANTTVRHVYGTISTNGYGFRSSASNVTLDSLNTSISVDQGGVPIIQLGNSGTASDMTVRDVDISVSGYAGAGVQVVSGTDIDVLGGSVSGAFEGVSIIDGEAITVDGVTINHVGRRAVSIDGDGTDSVSNVDIKNTNINGWMENTDQPDGAIDTYGPNVDNIRITDNTIDTTTTSAQGEHRAINITGSDDVVARGNDIRLRSSTSRVAFKATDRDGDLSNNVTFSENTVSIEADILYACYPSGVADITFNGNKYRVDSGVAISNAFVETTGGGGPVELIDETVDYCPGPYFRNRTADTRVEFRGLDLPEVEATAIQNYFSSAQLMSITDCRITTTTNNALIVEPDYDNYICADNYLESASSTQIANEGNGTTNEAISNNIRVQT